MTYKLAEKKEDKTGYYATWASIEAERCGRDEMIIAAKKAFEQGHPERGYNLLEGVLKTDGWKV